MKSENEFSNSGIFPRGEPVDAEHFVGSAWAATLIPFDNDIGCPAWNVTFAPGARNNWHSHPDGQILMVTAGRGYYQADGQPAVELTAGQVQVIPANIKHWHGAAADSWFVHLAICPNPVHDPTQWMEPVASEDYSKIKVKQNMNQILIAYFSHSGNTHQIAEVIHQITGGDLFEIKTIDAYPRDYDTVVDLAKKELRAGKRPLLAHSVEYFARYETIILGYPNWWNTMPMPVFTFLESYDFSGKTIAPYCTHGGSAMGVSEQDIRRLCPASKLVRGLPIYGTSVRSAGDAVLAWLKQELAI